MGDEAKTVKWAGKGKGTGRDQARKTVCQTEEIRLYTRGDKYPSTVSHSCQLQSVRCVCVWE